MRYKEINGIELGWNNFANQAKKKLEKENDSTLNEWH